MNADEEDEEEVMEEDDSDEDMWGCVSALYRLKSFSLISCLRSQPYPP